ncbi:hypothetical protein ITI46_30865 [Streptomyces oryzae]|uniref:Uncharacterized protein n=1 Tax=Streptomyces oryzae TaxID=1434886 RepID=A0ABS3XKT9_9ACTN|nr:hypothetical protein [Streptomyces oryzae]
MPYRRRPPGRRTPRSPHLPAPRPGADVPTGPAVALRAHAAALGAHAERLRAGAEALEWTGPEAAAFHHRVQQLAHRCTVAARSLTDAATLLDAR